MGKRDDYELRFGKHKGRTFQDVYQHEKGYVSYFYSKLENDQKIDVAEDFVNYCLDRDGKKRPPCGSLVDCLLED